MIEGGRYIRIGMAVFLGLVILGYGASKSINLVRGPQLQIDSPKDGETFGDPFLIISGRAENVAFITLNDRQIFVDDEGKITDQILLYEGYNVLTAKARGKFGREKVVTREVIYKKLDPPAENATGSENVLLITNP